MKLKPSLLFCLFIFFYSSCDKEDQENWAPNLSPVKIMISSEGNFTKGTASLDLIHEDGSVTVDVTRKVNNRTLGDVAQSFTIIDGKIFVTLNNSQKIEVFEADTYKSIATILYPARKISPQYIMPISDDEAIVADLWNSFMWIINTKTYKLEGEIPVSKRSTKQMLIADGKLFVTLAAEKIAVISLEKREVIKELEIPVVGDSKLLLDKNGNIWALACQFNNDDGEDIKPLSQTILYCIDPKDYAIKKRITLPEGYSVSKYGARLDMNAGKDELYMNAIKGAQYEGWHIYGEEGIFKISINDNFFPVKPLFYYSNKVEMLYNMAISPWGTIVICDALDYRQLGWVYEYDMTGNVLNEYKVGIIPQYIKFMR